VVTGSNKRIADLSVVRCGNPQPKHCRQRLPNSVDILAISKRTCNVSDYKYTVFAVWGKHPVDASEVDMRLRHQGRQPRDEVEGFEDDVRRADIETAC